MGNDGGVYMMSEELEDQNLMMEDMRLHMLIHLAGVSAIMGNKAMEWECNVIRIWCSEAEWESSSKNNYMNESLESDNNNDGEDEPNLQSIDLWPWPQYNKAKVWQRSS